MKIVIGLSTPRKKGVLSRIVQSWGGTKFSHAFIEIRSSYLREGNQIIYHASGTCVKIESADNFEKDNVVVKSYDLPIDRKIKRKIMNFAISRTGRPYNVLQLLGFVVMRLRNKLGFKGGNPWGGGGYVCTELVAELLNDHLGIAVRKDFDDVTLNDIEIILEENEKRNKIRSQAAGISR
jgi:uncharacterized protein YjhX (UPF0386 family)